jgi:hypothetical protein
MSKSPVPLDAVAVLQGLSPTAIQERVDALERERRALSVLLRSVRAREERTRRKSAASRQEAADE